MKIYFYSLVYLLLLNSCSRVNKEQNYDLIQKKSFTKFTKDLSNKYKSNKTDSRRLSDRTKYIIREDLNGAAIGATLGAGPHVIGAAAFGAGFFSLLAIRTADPPNSCDNQVCRGCNQERFKNSENPYDRLIGTVHNELLIWGLSNRTSFINNPADCAYNLMKVADSLSLLTLSLTSDSVHEFKLQTIETFLILDSLSVGNFYSSLEKQNDYLESIGVLNSFTKDIYADFLSTIYILQDYDEIYNYTIELEKELIGNRYIDNNDKFVLLCIFSVARHSSGLWLTGEIF